MPLPASGTISFNDINVELGVSGTTQASLGQASYRALAGVASGAISMSNFYGKANAFSFTISSSQTNADLRTLAVNAGWNQSTKVIATIASGIYCSSNSTGTPGLTISGSFPGGVELINNGLIIGRGGNGGAGGIYTPATNAAGNAKVGSDGTSGGLALSVSSAVSITNNGTIGGGGGGGGGGGCSWASAYNTSSLSTGSGGGGGRSSLTNSSGAAGGTSAISASGSFSVTIGNTGSAGTASAAAGTTAQPSTSVASETSARGGAGGAGGGWGSSGSGGGSGSASGSSTAVRAGGSGGGGGGAISGNSNITWLTTGTRLGAIS